MLGFGQFISEEGIVQLKNYKYRAGAYTYFDNAMQPFWNWFVTLFPLWVAPNLITLFGLFFMVFTVLQYLPYDASATQEFPAYTYYIGAVFLLLYQTFDAVDGKQARRTQQSSPLGQLFDHGCDAINATLVNFWYVQSMQIGGTWEYFAMSFFYCSSFYAAQWEEHETHMLRSGISVFGVTELQWSTAFVMTLNAVVGEITGTRLCKMNLAQCGLAPYLPEVMHEVNTVSLNVVVVIVLSSVTILTSIYNAISTTEIRPRILVLKGLMPLVMYTNMFYLIFRYTDWAWTHAGYVVMMSCPIVSLINSRQIVCNVANQKMSCLPLSTLWYFLFPLNRMLPQWYPEITTYATADNGQALVFAEGHVALFVTLITSLWYLHFAVGTIQQICNALDIWCLQIKPQHLKKH